MRAFAVPLLAVLSTLGCAKLEGVLDEEGGAKAQPEANRDACAEATEHERAKDYRAAREAYAQCLAKGTGHVDTHAAYQKILALEEGDAGARKAYDALLASNDGVVVRLTHARLQDREDRIARLERLIAEHPDFAPAYYELSLDYSAERLGERSLGDQAQEKQLLTAFLDRAKGKGFVDYFVDYDRADAQVEDARTRLSRLAGVDLSVLDEPVTMTAMASNAGWMLHFQVAEPTTALYYRLRDETDFTKIEGSMVSVPLQRMSTAVYIKYEDKSGAMRGPFELIHEPRSALGEMAKKALEMMPTAWVSLRDYDGKLLIYWTMLITYRCGLETVEYGLDTMTPDASYDPGECDPKNPYEVTGDPTRIYQELPLTTKFVSVRLVYSDGTSSKVQRFER
ncbi:MAG: hypothetical protein KDK70_03600 [Myxococcales bacterium]|nr:hypothetical protein [Myxococcales bacterium]